MGEAVFGDGGGEGAGEVRDERMMGRWLLAALAEAFEEEWGG